MIELPLVPTKRLLTSRVGRLPHCEDISRAGTDAMDAAVVADRARCGKTCSRPDMATRSVRTTDCRQCNVRISQPTGFDWNRLWSRMFGVE